MSTDSAQPIDAEPIYRLRKDALDWLLVDDEVVVLDQEKGLYLGTNTTGAMLWGKLEDGARRTDLIQLLVGHFEIDAGRAAEDVDAYLESLNDQDLLEEG